MKLWYKLLLATFLIWVTFFVTLTLILSSSLSAYTLIAINAFGLLCWLGTILILKNMVIDRLQRLETKVSKTSLNYLNFKKPVLLKKDVIHNLYHQFHVLSKEFQELEEKLASRWRNQKTLPTTKEKVTKLVHHDALTSLPNRVFFNEMLNKSLNHAARQNKHVAILFIDLDRFNHINETFGHSVGDKVLVELANRYASILRSGDIIARLGGDEFVVLLNDIGHPKFVSSIADKMLQCESIPIVVEDKIIQVTSSIGICIFPEDGTSLETLQKNADIALYKAKSAGGGVYQYFSNEMTLEGNRHVQLDKALRKAIENGEFILYYQPKLHLQTGTIIGVEALIRWDNPEIGLINPNQFIIQAEEMGLIMQIGEWALYEACRANKNWQDQGFAPISVAVNLSPQQFKHANIVEMVQNVLRVTHLDPRLLELEITENSIIEDVAETTEKLNKIKSLGVKICIDDFGTGFTSINFLKKFPINVLKIDQSFVKGIPENQNDVAISSAIIALGHNLGLQVVAEGVENIEQLDFLAEHQCDVIQGYYFSRPLPESKLILHLSRKK